MPNEPLLTVDGLSVAFGAGKSAIKVVDDVSFAVRRGETLALVGESGSGKTLTGKSLLGILPKGAFISAGSAILNDGGDRADLLAMSNSELRKVRGGRVSMIFQEPMSSLSSLHTIGNQVMEALTLHADCRGKVAKARCIETFESVGFPDPERAFNAYPFELSGGLRQRAMIAMAMVCRPSLMIADEPTTALDVTVQAQVMEVLHDVQRQTGLAMLLITHDLGLVAGSADRVQVMYASRLMEAGHVDEIFYESRNPYTRALLDSIPDLEGTKDEFQPIPGNPPSLLNPPSGCPFRPRCGYAIDLCAQESPPVVQISDGHASRCHRVDELNPLVSEASP